MLGQSRRQVNKWAMLGQSRRRWANIDLILFPEFYKQTIKKNN